MATKYVKYIGTSHVRQITKAEWSGVGVGDQDTIVWEKRNNWTVPLKNISDDAYPYIDADPELVIIDVAKSTNPDSEDTTDAALTANDAGKVRKPQDDDMEPLGPSSDTGGAGATSGGTGGQAPGSSTGSTGSSS